MNIYLHQYQILYDRFVDLRSLKDVKCKYQYGERNPMIGKANYTAHSVWRLYIRPLRQ